MTEWLCTLAQAKAELKADTTTDDQWVLDNIPLVSQRILNWTRQRYVPYIQTQYYDSFGPHISDTYRRLDLGRAILLPTMVIDSLDNTLVLNTDYVLVQQDSPAMQLQLISSKVWGWSYGFGFGSGLFWIAPGSYLRKITVTGQWGYRSNYPNEGWGDSGQTLGGALSDSATSITLSSVAAFSPGHVLQLDTEWLQCTAVDTATKTLTVQRGINGSTKASHLISTPISLWSVQPEIQRACVRWLGYWYQRRGSYEAVKNDLAQGKVVIYPDDAPAEVVHILEQTRDWRWGVV
jgi:hypothetical protein